MRIDLIQLRQWVRENMDRLEELSAHIYETCDRAHNPDHWIQRGFIYQPLTHWPDKSVMAVDHMAALAAVELDCVITPPAITLAIREVAQEMKR